MASEYNEAAAAIEAVAPTTIFKPLERPAGYPRQLEYQDDTLIGTGRRRLTYRVSEGEPIFMSVHTLLEAAENLHQQLVAMTRERDDLAKKVAALELKQQVAALDAKPKKKGD